MAFVKIQMDTLFKMTIKGGAERVIDLSKIPNRSFVYLLGYGIKQSVDCYSGEPDAKKAAVIFDRRWENLMRGQIPSGGGGRRGGYAVDPVWVEFVKVVNADAGSKGLKIKWAPVKKAMANGNKDSRRRVLINMVGKGMVKKQSNAAKYIEVAFEKSAANVEHAKANVFTIDL